MSIKPIISLQKLTKSYGKSRGIENISFDVMPGEVFGFLGPNGAGKTTAIRTLVGLIHATSGSAQILGHDALASSVELRKKLGICQEFYQFIKVIPLGSICNLLQRCVAEIVI